MNDIQKQLVLGRPGEFGGNRPGGVELAVVDARTLEPVPEAGPSTLVALAVRVGGTRLIDKLWINEAGEPIL